MNDNNIKSKVFNEEQDNLYVTHELLDEVINNLYNKVKLPSFTPDMDKEEKAFYNNQREILTFVHEQEYKKIRQLKILKEEVYFSRIDLIENGVVNTYYVSKNGLSSIGTIDWKSPIGNLVYDNTSSTYGDNKITLKRMFKISNKTLFRFNDIKIDGTGDLTDEYLISVLESKKDDNSVTDIIKTIQKVQNDIIRLPYNYNTAVIGCAGSGKTMILMHHLSYLKFDSKISWDKVKIITPNDKFKQAFSPLMETLEINDVETMTMTQYYIQKLKLNYGLDCSKIVDKLKDEFEIKPNVLEQIYSLDIQTQLINLYRKDVDDFFKNNRSELLLVNNNLDDNNCLKYIIKSYKKIDISFDNKVLFFRKRLNDRKNLISITEFCLNFLLEVKELLHTDESRNQSNEYTDLVSFIYKDLSDEFKKNTSLNSLINLNFNIISTAYDKFLLLGFENSTYSSWKLKANYFNSDSLSALLKNNYRIILESLTNNKNVEQNDRYKNDIKIFFRKPFDFIKKCFNMMSDSKHFINTKKYDRESIEKYNDIKEQLCNVIGHRWFNKKFIPIIINPILKQNQIKATNKYQFYFFYLLYFYSLFGIEKLNVKKDIMICIDEFQDLSPFEIDLINTLSHQSILNLYGDFAQCINGKGYKSEESLPKQCHVYYLNNNYRNTIQIADYYNKELNRNDKTIGVNGKEVKFISFNNLVNGKFEESDILICCNDLKYHLITLNLNIDIITVYEAKGMEYKKVHVLEEGMTQNEKYISYSRALSELIVVRK